jgi:hypothetical protein
VSTSHESSAPASLERKAARDEGRENTDGSCHWQTISSEVRAGLLTKYREMLLLRAGVVDGTVEDPRARMAALAAQFPGSLREIDEIPLGELERRVRILGEPGPDEPWMLAHHAFHRLLRGALIVRKRLARTATNLDGAPADLDATLDDPDALLWRESVEALAPREGLRLSRVVTRRLSQELSITAAELDSLLYAFGRTRTRSP